MLDTTRKLLERMLKSRLDGCIKDVGDLSNRQHGFRREDSITTATVREDGGYSGREEYV